ncbi:MAG: serine/threonine-protein kinase [Isosphaeraceae bacterium]
MSVNDDLASWGEPPANSTELAWTEFIDDVLAEIEQGQSSKTEMLRRNRPDLTKQGDALVRGATLLYQCASSVQEHSGMLDDPYATFSVAKIADFKDRPKVAAPSLPDPFPNEYRVCNLLGEGSFGKVWLADDLNLGWQVALKTLKLSGQSAGNSPVLAALRKEAKLLAAVRHPNIVQVHAWRQSGDEHYLVLQFVPGGSLAERVKAGPLPWQDAARYIADAGEGLLEVHARGIVHRDIKPANILWDTPNDEALVTDFGISSRLAEPGTVAGTPAYMAPEAFDGQLAPALDVYGLAASLFHLITRELPFPGKGLENLKAQKRRGLPDPDPRCQGMPEAIERVIRSGLAPEPSQRPGLKVFVETLRTSLNQTLVDTLVPTTDTNRPAPVNLKLMVSREVEPGVYQKVTTTRPKTVGLTRDMKKVPRRPEQVILHSGDRVRVEVEVDRSGYTTVFNVGPTGNLNLLYPDELDPRAPSPPMQPHRPLHVLDVEMAPPTGRERLFAVWSRSPLPLALADLHSLTEREAAGAADSVAYRATRDMIRLRKSVQQLRLEDWHAVVIEVDHV